MATVQYVTTQGSPVRYDNTTAIKPSHGAALELPKSIKLGSLAEQAALSFCIMHQRLVAANVVEM